MNIFALSLDPTEAAKMHCDRHVIKMQLESAQMLCTAQYITQGSPKLEVWPWYKPTHMNHPCNKWVLESKDNYEWLKQLAYALEKEWQFRYNHNKEHKAINMIRSLPEINLPLKGLTPFTKAMDNIFKVDDPIESYKRYYALGKDHLHKWKNRDKPIWIDKIVKETLATSI